MAAQEWKRREVKHCPTCKRTLPVSMFGSNRARYDGLGEYCRACNRDRQALTDHGAAYGKPEARVVRTLEAEPNRCNMDSALRAHTEAIWQMHVDLGIAPPVLP